MIVEMSGLIDDHQTNMTPIVVPHAYSFSYQCFPRGFTFDELYLTIIGSLLACVHLGMDTRGRLLSMKEA